MQSFIQVPFKTESGLTLVEGIAKFSPAGIVIEFESSFLGFIKTGVEENAIPLHKLFDVRFKKGFFRIGARIEIRLTSLAELSKLPNTKGMIALKIRRQDFDRAKEAVERLNRCLSEAHSAPIPVSIAESFGDGEAETRELIQ